MRNITTENGFNVKKRNGHKYWYELFDQSIARPAVSCLNEIYHHSNESLRRCSPFKVKCSNLGNLQFSRNVTRQCLNQWIELVIKSRNTTQDQREIFKNPTGRSSLFRSSFQFCIQVTSKNDLHGLVRILFGRAADFNTILLAVLRGSVEGSHPADANKQKRPGIGFSLAHLQPPGPCWC